MKLINKSFTLGIRFQSTVVPKHQRAPPKNLTGINHSVKPSAKLLNEKLKNEQDLRKERNKLAKASLKDIWAIFSPGGGDDDSELDLSKFDTKPIYANPLLFGELPFHKQQHIIDEIQEKFKKKWVNTDKNMKRFVYWLSYGSHGPREGFPDLYDYYSSSSQSQSQKLSKPEEEAAATNNSENSKGSEDLLGKFISSVEHQRDRSSNSTDIVSNKSSRDPAPIDLPFKVPSILKSIDPTPETKVTKLPTLDPRSFGTKRIEQYRKDRKMNPVNKAILFILVFLTILNFKKDRRVNLTGVVPEYEWDIKKKSSSDEEPVVNAAAAATTTTNGNGDSEPVEQTKRAKRWYYLWLR